MNRADYIPAPHKFNLNMACRALAEAFGPHIFLVGSAHEKRDYRDVDVRVMLPDEDWERLFPGLDPGRAQLDPLWSIMCAAISLYLSQHSDLPVDFQIQQRTKANEEYPKEKRGPLGLFAARPEVNGRVE